MLRILTMKKYYFFISFWISLNIAFGQDYKLKIFTQNGCSRCSSVLEVFEQYKLNYQNFEISSDISQTKMWEYLANVGETKAALVPIIILNEELIFPVYKNGIRQKIDRLTFAQNLAEKLSQSQIETNSSTNEKNKKQASGKYHVICGSYSNKTSTENLCVILKSKGYLNAKIIEENETNKVSISNFSSLNDAKKVQNIIKKEYSGAWIYSLE